MPLISGVGLSFLGLFQLLFQFYMVVWFVSLISRYGSGLSLMNILQRAFIPLKIISDRLGIPVRYYYLFIFLFLWIFYGLLSYFIYNFMTFMAIHSSFSIFQGLGEGLILFLRLFPGFFSVVIIIGVLLSWVSPDPYNPIVQTIYSISEPLLAPFRRFVPILGGLDISPIFALLCFQFLGKIGQQLVARIIGAI
jgi:YggT family protein